MNNISKQFTFIDLFAGIGGLRIPFEKIGGECVFSSEIDKYARETYMENFGEEPYGDIRDPTIRQFIPDNFDLLIAGFPCQPFSLAGVVKANSMTPPRPHGFEDYERGNLFLEIESILAEKRPKCFVLENVKHLKSHDNGNTFKVILEKLQGLNYAVEHKVINALHFLPQNRERIVIVGFNKELKPDFNDEWSLWNYLLLPQVNNKTMKDILHAEDGTEEIEKDYITGPLGNVNSKYILTPGVWGSLQRHAQKHKDKGNGFGYSVVGPDSAKCRTLSARYYKDGAEILISRGEGQIPRRMTPRECARLMGFPEEFSIPVSDGQAYRQFGNSVAIPVFDEIARLVKPYVVS